MGLKVNCNYFVLTMLIIVSLTYWVPCYRNTGTVYEIKTLLIIITMACCIVLIACYIAMM